MIIETNKDLHQESKAIFSDCRKYRYWLDRVWDDSKQNLCFLMLNPSTADAFKNDPTIARCQRRAQMLGYGSITIVNLMAYRLTDSRQLKCTPVMEGLTENADNFAYIVDAVKNSGITICGWGRHEVVKRMAKIAHYRLDEAGLLHKLYALKLTKDGSPQHPLYIGYDVQPQSMPWQHKNNIFEE